MNYTQIYMCHVYLQNSVFYCKLNIFLIQILTFFYWNFIPSSPILKTEGYELYSLIC
jgi:hypothetical protein